jgi:hypothetical protein
MANLSLLLSDLSDLPSAELHATIAIEHIAEMANAVNMILFMIGVLNTTTRYQQRKVMSITS